MRVIVTKDYDNKGRPRTTVQAAEVHGDTLYTASVDARGGLQAARARAADLVRSAIIAAGAF